MSIVVAGESTSNYWDNSAEWIVVVDIFYLSISPDYLSNDKQQVNLLFAIRIALIQYIKESSIFIIDLIQQKLDSFIKLECSIM